jgi:hypothetical protein
MIPEIYISLLDKIYDEYDFEEHKNPSPLVALISPEWSDSESYKIAENVDLCWDHLKCIESFFIPITKIRSISHEYYIGFENTYSCWYQPYHFVPRTNWGIHIRYDNWLKIGKKFNYECPNLINEPSKALKSAFLYLYVHSLFHFLIENFASIIEIGKHKPDLYINYYKKYYYKNFNSDNCIEESLATLYLYMNSECCKINHDYLKQILLQQKKSYKNFLYFQNQIFDSINQLLYLISPDYQSIADLDLNYNSIDLNKITFSNGYNVPIWLHHKPLPLNQLILL